MPQDDQPKGPLPIFAYNMRCYQNAAKRAGFNQSNMAKRAGRSKAMWSQLLIGKVPNPRIWTAMHVAETLHVPLASLITTDAEYRTKIERETYEFWLKQLDLEITKRKGGL